MKGILFMLTSGCCWGCHGVLIKSAYALGGSFIQVFLCEALFASIFFGVFGRTFLRPVRPRGFKQWRDLFMIGLATIGIGVFLFLSYSLGPVAIPATLMFLYLPVVYLFSIFTKRQSFSLIKAGAISLVLLGAVLTTEIFSTFEDPGAIPAILAAVTASMCYAVVFIMTPAISAYTTAEFRSFTVSFIAFLGCVVIVFFVPSLWYDLSENTFKFVLLALFLGVVGQTLPLITLMKGLPLTGSSLGGVLASVELPIAVFSAALLLGESLNPLKVTGVALVLTGIIIYNLSDREQIEGS
ncbi:MAG: DMT family transporter [Verrucomicrobiota bacterium]